MNARSVMHIYFSTILYIQQVWSMSIKGKFSSVNVLDHII